MRPLDAIALAITITVCLMLLVDHVAIVWTGQWYEEGDREVAENIVLAMVAIVSMYVGAALKNE